MRTVKVKCFVGSDEKLKNKTVLKFTHMKILPLGFRTTMLRVLNDQSKNVLNSSVFEDHLY